MAKSKLIITDLGKTKIAAAAVSGTTLKLKTFAVGDSNGSSYEPSGKETALRNEKFRNNLIAIKTNPENPQELLINAVVPETVNGFCIWECGVFDETNDLILIGQMDGIYKETDGDITIIDVTLGVSLNNAASIEMVIDLSAYVPYDFLLNQDYAVKGQITFSKRPKCENSVVALTKDLPTFANEEETQGLSIDNKVVTPKSLGGIFKRYLGEKIDLNRITGTGYYSQNNDGAAASGTNYPVPHAGLLEVHQTSTFIFQKYTTWFYDGNPSSQRFFLRSYYAGERMWSQWIELASKADLENLLNWVKAQDYASHTEMRKAIADATPIATAARPGLVKPGKYLKISQDGILDAVPQAEITATEFTDFISMPLANIQPNLHYAMIQGTIQIPAGQTTVTIKLQVSFTRPQPVVGSLQVNPNGLFANVNLNILMRDNETVSAYIDKTQNVVTWINFSVSGIYLVNTNAKPAEIDTKGINKANKD